MQASPADAGVRETLVRAKHSSLRASPEHVQRFEQEFEEEKKRKKSSKKQSSKGTASSKQPNKGTASTQMPMQASAPAVDSQQAQHAQHAQQVSQRALEGALQAGTINRLEGALQAGTINRLEGALQAGTPPVTPKHVQKFESEFQKFRRERAQISQEEGALHTSLHTSLKPLSADQLMLSLGGGGTSSSSPRSVV
jgi:hypothetical protein